ncbi:phage portal protein [Nocardioides panaciterrulae]|uniref:HK97 family phage portal protein n=1 Tax=Nocardioides panaciterrulae TaxID=661492 RepID=A0A7Y9EAP4_9ACTN|nr:phage portal protein [Nocardioides panaciterrulae]NYD43940.1 HK97 family phage portal protein [Nocardioides panaciterrulae]NYD44009.1 HK97 family phage portal protein [Nocardioides panaciterrulae]
MAVDAVSLFFRGRTEQRSMQSWVDADGFTRQPNETRATRLGPVFAAIRHIVDYGSTLPLDSYRKLSEAERIQMPLPRLLSRLEEPGGIGVDQWIGQALYGLAVHGNAVGWVSDVDGWGYPLAVTWLQRGDWEWSEAAQRWYVFGAPVPFANVVHIPWLVPSGKRIAMSPIEHYASITCAGLSAQEYADMKRGGGLPPMVLRNSERLLDAAAAEKVSDRLTSRLALGKPFVTGKDWDLTAPEIPPNHLQFIDTLKLTATQIAAIYGIDPVELGGAAPNSLTYQTEELRQIRRASDMRPYLVRVENALARLLPNRQYVKFNVDATMRVDIKTRTEITGAQIADGRLSVDEARALEDRPPVAGGDRHNVPAPKQEPNTRKEQP